MAVKNKETVIEPVSPVFWIDGGYGAFQKVGSAYNLYDANGDYFGTVFSFSEVCRRLEERGKSNG